MMSGIRNSPPISISSPRETNTFLPLASAASVSTSAAAQLFTTSAASAPVSEASSSSARAPRELRCARRAVDLQVGVALGRAADGLDGAGG